VLLFARKRFPDLTSSAAIGIKGINLVCTSDNIHAATAIRMFPAEPVSPLYDTTQLRSRIACRFSRSSFKMKLTHPEVLTEFLHH
jgi:hypothetical protein